MATGEACAFSFFMSHMVFGKKVFGFKVNSFDLRNDEVLNFLHTEFSDIKSSLK